MIKFVHLHSFGSNNIGNYALINGVQSSLCSYFHDTQFYEENWDQYNWLDQKKYADLANLVNSKANMLVVGGAMVFDGVPRYRNSGFRFNLALSEWKLFKKPIVFYSVGYGAYDKAFYHNKKALSDTLKYIDDNPTKILFGIRNDGTKEWLESLTNRIFENFIITPDPALYVTYNENDYHPEFENGKFNIVLSLNSEMETYRFGGRWPQKLWKFFPDWQIRKKFFLSNLARAINKFALNRDINLILCAHEPEDYKILYEFLRPGWR